ncbi:tetratricopeptide repeat protein, partial [Azotobacter chroococcum]|nr:tetratricopeptide repeat protein [Azotobacter chroococcum]
LRQTQADLLLKQNQPAAAEKVISQLLASRPQDPDIWYLAAEVRGLSGDIVGVHQARAEYFALVGNYDQAIEQLDFAKRRASGNFQLAARMDARQRDLKEEKKMIEEMLR